jgi:H+-transporting ATPase
VFNAALGFFQEARAQATLAALKKRLAMTASVRRDGAWKNLPAAELVPGDIVKLSLGGVVAADVKLIEGNVLLDQSMLTGESIGTEAGPGFQTFAGALVRRGEAVAGSRRREPAPSSVARPSWFARPMSSVHNKRPCLRVVRNLAMFNGIADRHSGGVCPCPCDAGERDHPLVLTAVLASIPVALPATFTLASALGARALGTPGRLANPALGRGRSGVH